MTLLRKTSKLTFEETIFAILDVQHGLSGCLGEANGEHFLKRLWAIRVAQSRSGRQATRVASTASYLHEQW